LLQIIKTFEFNSSLQRMSVIVKSGQELKIFCKGIEQDHIGSPENIYRLCKKETLPENYTNILNFYSMVFLFN
jgi:cation-transporting ATPase 13A2